ncbi:MAG: acyl carrier protein [Phycisphaeraceae bacterium]|nr:acyl carrier protein [Phycisphaeraceae bacterium]
MTREDIFDKVRGVLIEALALDEDEVTPNAKLTSDLGAESIDFLDIQFQLEQAFGFKIEQGELFPENVQQDPEFVQGGKVTEKGIVALKEKLPHADFTELQSDPRVSRVPELFTVDAIVNFCQRKLAASA